MNTIKIRINQKGQQSLQFVKLIKSNTNLGLRDAKDWCDNVNSNVGVYFTLNITTTLEQFKREALMNLSDYQFSFEDREKERQIKIVSLGLGDIYDKIEVISDEMASDLLFETKKRNTENLFNVYQDYFKDFLITLTAEQLDKLVDEKTKKLFTN